MRTAGVLVTHPGLYTPFEAFAHRIPTLLLPSSNYTQLLQLRLYRVGGIGKTVLDWEDMGIMPPGGLIPEGLPEEIGVNQVLHCIKMFEESPKAQRLFVGRLARELERCLQERESMIELQDEFYRSLSWTSGPEVAASAIEALLGLNSMSLEQKNFHF